MSSTVVTLSIALLPLAGNLQMNPSKRRILRSQRKAL